MKNLCTNCSIELGKKPDIDVEKEFNELEEGYISSGFICDGCGLIAITRQDGKLKVMKMDESTESSCTDWEDYILPDKKVDI